MSEFRFKRFTVVNELSAMKVNTDGVLLGALMTVRADDLYSLDIGTGTGTVALMAAQRLSDLRRSMSGRSLPEIHAIDIDGPSAYEAGRNFARSSWSAMLSAENISLADFADRIKRSGPHGENPPVFSHIFSNPPYFESALRSPDLRRREARHSESLSYREILEFGAEWLAADGICSVILPSEMTGDLYRYARMCGLFPFRAVNIRTTPQKNPRRTVSEFSRSRVPEVAEEQLVIQENGRYTERYAGLMSPYYLDRGRD